MSATDRNARAVARVERKCDRRHQSRMKAHKNLVERIEALEKLLIVPSPYRVHLEGRPKDDD